jgi:23S rRNA pseudouridine1911/1915/1917 synthase
MSEIKLIIKNQKGRLDKILAEAFPEYSRSFFTNKLLHEKVLVNKKLIDAKYKVKENDEIEVDLTTEAVPELKPEDMPLDIIYEDDDLIVVNKPQGMVVHPSAGHSGGTLVNALLAHSPLSTINGEFRPGIVHRIDKDTSGLLMIAKNDKAHVFLSNHLKENKIGRVYLALVHGKFKETTGTINAPIGRHPIDRKKQAVVANGKSAVTHFKVVEEFNGFTLLEVKLETGRTHQIRVHLAYIGHPISADHLYGYKKTLTGSKGQYLHAKTLQLIHPTTGREMKFDSELPEYFLKQLEKLRN